MVKCSPQTTRGTSSQQWLRLLTTGGSHGLPQDLEGLMIIATAQ
jgi:hypothetical protein